MLEFFFLVDRLAVDEGVLRSCVRKSLDVVLVAFLYNLCVVFLDSQPAQHNFSKILHTFRIFLVVFVSY